MGLFLERFNRITGIDLRDLHLPFACMGVSILRLFSRHFPCWTSRRRDE
jgi:hypothetical protein